ncbi:Transcription factor spt8 [Coemansia sp. RSA 2050]|nr:Transcription factor spt8 [Coemansia sp. RSA 2050]KAJ2737188.1 Transcription factor spt8 [Coemansia sp. BCRC 34962]
MSEAGFNDDFLEKELFGGDDDGLDSASMDVDDMMLTGQSMATVDTEPASAADDADVATAATAGNGNSAPEDDSRARLERSRELLSAKLDIAMDDPPGELTVLRHPPRALAGLVDGAQRCSAFDVVPTISLVNPWQIHSVTATPNMRWLFTGGEDGYIKKWDFNSTVNGKQLLTLGQRHSLVDTIAKGGVTASYWDHTDVVEGGVEMLSPVYSMAVHSQAVWLVSGMKSGHIGLWSVRHDEGRRISLLCKHKKPVSVLRISPDEYGLVSGSWDRAVLYWDLNTGRLARGFAGHTSQISSIEFQPSWFSERNKASQGSDPASGEASVGDAGKEFNFQTKGPVLLTTSIDGQCLLWDVRAPKALPHPLDTPKKTPPWAMSACWSRDGKRIYVGRRNNSVDEYEFGAGSLPVRTLRLPQNSGPVTALAAMANGRHLVCASTDNVRIWDLEQPVERRSTVPFQVIPGHHGGTISSVFIDESSRFMLTPSGNRGWEGTSNGHHLGYELTPVS